MTGPGSPSWPSGGLVVPVAHDLRPARWPGAARRTWARHPQLALACRAAVAATLAWLVASVIPGPAAEYPYYAPLGAVIATSTTLRGSVLESLQTVAGIVVGAAIALGVSAVMPSTWLTVSVVVLLGALVAGWRRLGSG